MDWNWTPVLGIMFGMNEAIFKNHLSGTQLVTLNTNDEDIKP